MASGSGSDALNNSWRSWNHGFMYCLFTSQVYELSVTSNSVNETFNESSMNASMAEDIDDCMALLEEAEKKVRHDSSLGFIHTKRLRLRLSRLQRVQLLPAVGYDEQYIFSQENTSDC